MPVRLFLSYARNDDETFVARLHAALTAAGFSVWFDRVSMPSRSLTFHQEIRDAVTACDRLVLVVGPYAVSSDYVTQEWRFAYFEAVKCVNPIVRTDAVDAAGQKIDAYSLIPEDLRLVHAEDFRDDAQFDAHIANLIRQLNDPLPPAGKLVAVPELPPHYLDQPARIAALRDILLADLQKPVVVSGAVARVGLQGMGGIGKSVLASALAHRPEVRRAFPDGVYWVTLGQEPNVADLQRGLARALGDNGLFTGVDAGKEKLRELLGGRAALLVLDDVWQRAHADAFNVLGPRGRLLLTTRDAGLVTALAAKENHYQVQLPTKAEAEALLAKAAGVPVPELPAEARDIVDECGRLPLGLALCGGMVHGGRTWQDVLGALREHDLEYLSDSHPAEEQHRSIWKAMDVSIRALQEDERERFAELAVFALDTGAPEAALETLWGHTAGLTARRGRDLLMNFRQRSLIDFDQSTRWMTVHDLLHNFATGMAAKRFGSLAALHVRLLDAYRKACTNGWPSGPNDGYFFQNLVSHLLTIGHIKNVEALLTDLPWIEAKCKAGLAFGLEEDYRQTIEIMPAARASLAEERRRQQRLAKYTRDLIAYSKGEVKVLDIPESLEPWSNGRIEAEAQRIRDNPTELDRLHAYSTFVEGELYSLAEFGTRPGFVAQHAFNSAPTGLIHSSSLTAIDSCSSPVLLKNWFGDERHIPRQALLRTIRGSKFEVHGVAVTPDGRLAASGWDDNACLWDLQAGTPRQRLQGHARAVDCVDLTPDGQWAVSGAYDNSVRLWALGNGTCLQVLKGHRGNVDCVSITPDGRRVVSGSWDKTLRVWNTATGKCRRILKGHSDSVSGVAVTPDGKRAVSGSWDTSLRVWDLESGKCLRVLEGHSDRVLCVGLTPDGRLAVSAGWDETIRVWDIGTGLCRQTLTGHTGWVSGVSITADGRLAVSGSHDNTLRIWDLKNGQCLRALNGHTFWVYGVSITADGSRAVSAGGDETVREWDVSGGESEGISLGYVNCISVTLDGRIAVTAEHGTLRVWDVSTGNLLRTLKGHLDQVDSICLTKDGKRAVSASFDHTLRIWDLVTGECVGTLKGHTDIVYAVSLTEDGQQAVSGSLDKTVRVWDLATGKCVRTVRGFGASVDSVSLTPSGRLAVLVIRDKALVVYDLALAKVARTLEDGVFGSQHVTVTSDGQRAVSSGRDGTLRLWDIESGVCLRKLEGHSNVVHGLSVTADGQRVISAGSDGTLRVWNLDSGICDVVLCGPGQFRSVAFADSLNRVAAGNSTNEVVFYDVRGIDLGGSLKNPHA